MQRKKNSKRISAPSRELVVIHGFGRVVHTKAQKTIYRAKRGASGLDITTEEIQPKRISAPSRELVAIHVFGRVLHAKAQKTIYRAKRRASPQGKMSRKKEKNVALRFARTRGNSRFRTSLTHQKTDAHSDVRFLAQKTRFELVLRFPILLP